MQRLLLDILEASPERPLPPPDDPTDRELYWEILRFLPYQAVMEAYHLTWWEALQTPPQVIRLCAMLANTREVIRERNRPH